MERICLVIEGMTCGSCSFKIEKTLEKIGASKVTVNWETKHAEINYDPSLISLDSMKQKIIDLGFQVAQVQIVTELIIEGMTCGSCSFKIEKTLEKMGASQVKVNWETKLAVVTYDPSILSLEAIKNKIVQLGFKTDDSECVTLAIPQTEKLVVQTPRSPRRTTDENEKSCRFIVSGMSCASCAFKIEHSLGKAPGVRQANVNFATVQANVIFDCRQTDENELVRVITDLGFAAEVMNEGSMESRQKLVGTLNREDEIRKYKRWLILATVFTLPLMVISMVLPRISEHLKMGLMSQVVGRLETTAIIQFFLATPVVCISAYPFYKNAAQALRRISFNMDVLVCLGVGSAYFGSVFYMIATATDYVHKGDYYFGPAAALLTFMLLGKTLENLAKRKTSEAMLTLMDLQPKTALLMDGEDLHSPRTHEREINVESIKHGDLLKVIAGSKVPVDGDVVEGSGSVNEAMVTGESIPVYKTSKDSVIGGTVCIDGLLYVRATKLGDESTLSQILRLVQEAQTQKAPIQALADKISGFFVPVVICIAVFTFIVWIVLGKTGAYPITWRMEDGWWKNVACRNLVDNYTHTKESDLPHPEQAECTLLQTSAMIALRFLISMLVVACPCAMGLATPTAVMVGTGKGAQSGILIKSAQVLEFANKAQVVLFDKTGTLTVGKMAVCRMEFPGLEQNDSQKKLQVLLSVMVCESSSRHPIATAIVEKCSLEWMNNRGGIVPHIIPIKSETIPGKGVQVVVDGKRFSSFANGNSEVTVCVASFKHISSFCKVSPIVQGIINTLHSNGNTSVVASIDDTIVAVFGISDEIKPEAGRVVLSLKHNYGIRVCMVTGDNRRAALHVASQVGIDNDDVFSEVLPGDKSSIVEKCQNTENTSQTRRSGGSTYYRNDSSIVVFVGDGINDSPALTRADVGIAMGSGTEVAMDSADVVIMNSNLGDVIATLDLAKATLRRIKWNFIWAFGYNVIALPLSAGVLFPLTQWQLPPVAAGISMTCSSLLVLSCSLSLKLWKKPSIR